MEMRVSCDVMRDFYQTGNIRKFTVECDEPNAIGGTDRAPRPLEYLLLGLAFCQASICVEMASLLSVELSKVHVAVKGVIDLRGIYGVADVNPGFQDVSILLDLQVAESATKELVEKLLQLLRERCPAYATFVNQTRLTTSVKVDGSEWR
jgi:uncharacterized OsmC-like protein